MIRTSTTSNAVAAALAAAQGELATVTKDARATVPTKSGGQYAYTYATLASVVEAVRPALAAHKLAPIQGVTVEDLRVTVTTRIAHESGEWIETDVMATAAASSPQAIGSVITYCRRYGLCAVLCLATEDDDGAAGEGQAAGNGNRRQVSPAPAARPVPQETPKGPAPAAATPATQATGAAVANPSGRARFPTQQGDRVITEPQAKRLWALCHKALEVAGTPRPEQEAAIRAWLVRMCGTEHSHAVTWRQYRELFTQAGEPIALVEQPAAAVAAMVTAPPPETPDEVPPGEWNEDNVPF